MLLSDDALPSLLEGLAFRSAIKVLVSVVTVTASILVHLNATCTLGGDGSTSSNNKCLRSVARGSKESLQLVGFQI
ncbi:uncharacterized protein BT62DRAFT_1000862 [Guyanagaster necrorhizus]|uniref:Uncharacterized protein n=1 Tax=Guyanagaster necrorhizus TaxID=856835 RepID=A0A9P7W1I8_9AGAR|nr:uncharacterized protein BT62DRAFT_1000862 [Guyanagaster necrorhizus MCA 3950]KAG7451606.1 hypothetical protein BT62DRAFT_1000862 [Guyanagaster necrorhizus MCA 3950]